MRGVNSKNAQWFSTHYQCPHTATNKANHD
jgi:hypothetical protein